MISLVDVKHFIGLGKHKINFDIGIEGRQLLIGNYWIITVEPIVPIEALKVAIVVIHSISIDLSGRI
jgi:hypothetical protein